MAIEAREVLNFRDGGGLGSGTRNLSHGGNVLEGNALRHDLGGEYTRV